MNFNHDLGLIDTLLSIDTTNAPPLGGTTGSLTIVGTGSLTLPSGTTAQRPANAAGQIRYNADSGGSLEFNNGTGWATVSVGGGSVTSVTVTTGTGMLVGSGSTQTITSTGTFSLALNSELQGLSGLSTLGLVARTGTGTYVPVTLTGTAGDIVVTNGNGTGTPTIDLATVTQGSTGTSLVKVAFDTKGRITNNVAVATADLTPLLNSTYLALTGGTVTGNITMSGATVTGLPTPVNPGDAVSLAYYQAGQAGLEWKSEAQAATTAALTVTYANGASGVGATLTNAGSQAAFAVDGYTANLNDRILVKNQSSALQNGIYTVTTLGSGSTNWVLTRAIDSNTSSSVDNETLFVTNGATNANTGWTQTSANPTIGTNAITFVQFSGSGTYVAGTGLTLTGNTFSITAPVSVALGGTGLTSTPTNGQIDIGNGTNFTRTTLTQGTGITVTNGTGSITIANAGVTSNVAGTGIGVSGATGAVTITNTGVTSLAGTANQISASASTGSVTLSLPSAVTLPGSLTVTTSATVSGLTANSFLYSGTAGLLTSTAAPTHGQLLIGSTGAAPVAATLTSGTGISIANAAGSITISNTGVTSVTVSGGTTGLTTSGSPITTTGTITLAGTLGVANGGTGLTSTPANGAIDIGNGTNFTRTTITQGTGITITNGSGSITIANSGVTSVGLALPSIFTVTGSPVTTTGTLTGTLNTQASNAVFVGPASGGPLTPTFRTLVASDISTAIQLYRENPSSPTTPTVTGPNAIALGSGSTASGTNSLAIGAGSSAYLQGGTNSAAGSFATAGDAQFGMYVARNITTTATTTELFLDGTTATQRLVMPNNSVWAFRIRIAARRTDAVGGGAGYTVDGAIRKDTTAASTTLIGAVSKSVLGETNTAWDVSVTADTTNGSLKIAVTGEAAKTIRWVAVVDVTEVTN